MAAERVLLSEVLLHRDQFYGKAVVLVGYVVRWSEIGAAVYPEFGAEHRHAKALWFDWPKAYREQASRFDRKYVVIHGTVQPAPTPATLVLDGTMDKHRGWSALLEPVTYLLPLSEHPVPEEAGEQHYQDCQRLLRSGKSARCPFCFQSSPPLPRFVEDGRKQYEGGYSGAYFICGHCGRSFGPADYHW